MSLCRKQTQQISIQPNTQKIDGNNFNNECSTAYLFTSPAFREQNEPTGRTIYIYIQNEIELKI